MTTTKKRKENTEAQPLKEKKRKGTKKIPFKTTKETRAYKNKTL